MPRGPINALPRAAALPPPPQLYEVSQTWTPDNTVVTGSDKVLKWDPDDEDNCDTGAAFTIDHLDYGDPDWKVTVKVYNAESTLLKTLVQEGGFEVGENSVTWDGTREPPPLGPGGTAPKGLYTYTVEADHTVGGPYYPFMCKDTDKATTPELQETAVHKVSFDVPSLVLTLDVDYQVLQAAAVNGRIAIYDPNFNQIAVHNVGPNGDGQVPANYSGTERFTLQLAADQMGVFTAVFIGEQTAQAGLTNRDEQPKAARQGLGTVELRPAAYVVSGEEGEVEGVHDEFAATVADAMAELSATDPANAYYPPPPYYPVRLDSSGTAQAIYNMLEDNQDDPSAVVFYNGHAGTNVLYINWPSGGTDKVYGGNMIGGQPQPNTPGNPGVYYLANLSPGALSRTALIVFAGCHTLGEEAQDGDSLWGAALDKGAEVAAGFTGSPRPYDIFFGAFWEELNCDGGTLSDARYAGLAAVYAEHNQYYDCDTFDIRPAPWSQGWALRLRPARYGQ